MCGCTDGINISTEAPEYNKRFKPENNKGCCCQGLDDCDTPSRAVEGSPLWKWEQLYGRLIGQFVEETAPDGRKRMVYVKTTCPESEKPKKNGCCSLNYRVQR
jgi:hypothetical protein